jgi:hypothetical protein
MATFIYADADQARSAAKMARDAIVNAVSVTGAA